MALLLLGKPFCPLPFLSDCWVTISVDNGLWIRNGMAHMGLSHAHDDDDGDDDDDDDTHTRVLSSHAGPSFVFSSSVLPAPAREIAPRIRELRRRRLLGSTANQPTNRPIDQPATALGTLWMWTGCGLCERPTPPGIGHPPMNHCHSAPHTHPRCAVRHVSSSVVCANACLRRVEPTNALRRGRRRRPPRLPIWRRPGE